MIESAVKALLGRLRFHYDNEYENENENEISLPFSLRFCTQRVERLISSISSPVYYNDNE